MAFSPVVRWKAHLNTEYVVEESYTTHNQINLTGRGKIWCSNMSKKMRIIELLKLQKISKKDLYA